VERGAASTSSTTMNPAMMNPEMMKAAQDMMSKMSPDDMQQMMKMQSQMMQNPAMMQQAQQMMQNPAMAQQAAAQMKNMSADDVRKNIKQAESQLPKMAAAAPAAPVSAVAKLKSSAMAVPDDLLHSVEEAEKAKADGNASFKSQDFKAAASKYREGTKLTDEVLDENTLSGADKRAVVELMEACHLNLANCQLKLSDWDGAVDECTKVLSRADNRKARFRRGDAYTQLGKLTEAREDLEKAVKMDPSDEVVKGKLKAVESKLGVESRIEEVEEVDTSAAKRAKASSGSGSSGSAPPMMPSMNPAMRDPAAMDAALDAMTPEQMAAQAEMLNNMTPEQMKAMGMPEGVDKEQLKMASEMFKGMDKEQMKSMAKMAAQMQPQMQAMKAAKSGGGGSSSSSGGGSGSGDALAAMAGGMPDPSNMSMDQGIDMMKNMSPDMMQAGMDMMKNMDPAMMKNMSKMMGKEIDEGQLEQMQKMMSGMKPEDMQKWAGRAQKVASAAAGPMAAYKKVTAQVAKVGYMGFFSIFMALLAIMSVGHLSSLF